MSEDPLYALLVSLPLRVANRLSVVNAVGFTLLE
jgi:hypothetical protein